MAEYLIYTSIPVSVCLTVEADNEKEAKKVLRDYLSERNYDYFDLDVTGQLVDRLDNLNVINFKIKENK